MECPICGNRQGFAFGTCGECGWNHLDNTFHFIEVSTADLRPEDREWLTAKHRRLVEKAGH
jgi:hypothetical protein